MLEQWYAARVRPGTEFRVARDVFGMGYPSWTPAFRMNGERKWPVFPCYTFVEFDVEQDRWSDIIQHRDVVKLLPLNEPWPVHVPRKFIDECKRREADGAFDMRGSSRLMLKYKAGDRVRITSGVLRDRIVRFIAQHTDNAIVEMVLFGRTSKFPVPAGFIGDPA